MRCLRLEIDDLQVQNFSEIRIIEYEDSDNDSDNGVGFTVHGVRPDNGARKSAGPRADEGNGGDSAGEREEDASRAGAEQTADKTRDGHRRTWTDER